MSDGVIYVLTDGAISHVPIHAERAGGYCDDWRDVAIDALVAGDLSRAGDLIERGRLMNYSMAPEREDPPLYTLPAYDAGCLDDARAIVVRHCRLAYDTEIVPQTRREIIDHGYERRRATGRAHPMLGVARWYQLNRFDGTVEDLQRVAEEFEATHREIVNARSRRDRECPLTPGAQLRGKSRPARGPRGA